MDIDIICCKDNNRKTQISKATNILNNLQNYFFYKVIYRETEICENKLIDWYAFCDAYGKSIGKYTIFITENPFNDNWFSHESNKYSIISTDSWETSFAPPSLCAYLVYQIAQSTINFEADLSEKMEMRMVHDKPEGCIFDLCINKHDIKLGMIAGTICPQCRSVLLRYGVQERAINAIERILLYVRSEAIGKPIIFNENEAFIVMRFSNNDENDHVYKYGIRPALETLSINCLRADDKVESGQLLQKIRQSIEKCRFIIAKVDTDNLNVYFELGLAMGLEKEVLLISEDDLIVRLPADLRNWECLTVLSSVFRKFP